MKQLSDSHTSKEYLARDLGLCSALSITPGIKLLRLDKDPSGFYWFVFSNISLCESVAQRYWFDSLVIDNAKAYNDARKSLMDKLHSQTMQYA